MKSTQNSYFDSWGMAYILRYIKFRTYCVLVTIQKAGLVGAFYLIKRFLSQE